MNWRFSASQISTWEDCPRKWGWKYLDRIYAEPHPSAQLGTEVHGHLEQWLKAREIPPDTKAGKLAQVMVPYLPPPQMVNPEYVERKFQVGLGPHSFIGYIDLVLPERGEKPPLINDHKTTGNMGYALGPEDLPGDVQGSLYAYWGFLHTKKEQVLLQWLYGRTQGTPLVLPVQRVVTRPEVEPRLLKTIESADDIQLVFETGIKTAKDLPYDANACEKYGGCPFQHKCGLTPKERMKSIMAQGTRASFFGKLRKQKEAQAQKPAPEPAAEAADVNPPEQSEVPEEAPVEAPSAKTSRGPGRPKGSKNKKNSGSSASNAEDGGWTLYVNCQPIKLPDGAPAPEAASTIISAVNGGGEGRSGHLDAIREALQKEPPAGGIVIDTNEVEQRDALLSFVQEAGSVVQA